MEDDTIAIINNLSPIFQDMLYRRIRATRYNLRNKRCSFCHMYGHKINNCCHDSALAILANMCLDMDDLLYRRNLRYDELQTTLETFLGVRLLNEIKLFVSLFDYSTSHSKRRLTRIIIYEMTHVHTATAQNRNRPLAPSPEPTTILPRNIHVVFQIDDEEDDTVTTHTHAEVCPICLDDIQRMHAISTNCNHQLCAKCTCQYVARSDLQRQLICPLCRCTIDKLYANSQESFLEVSRLF